MNMSMKSDNNSIECCIERAQSMNAFSVIGQCMRILYILISTGRTLMAKHCMYSPRYPRLVRCCCDWRKAEPDLRGQIFLNFQCLSIPTKSLRFLRFPTCPPQYYCWCGDASRRRKRIRQKIFFVSRIAVRRKYVHRGESEIENRRLYLTSLGVFSIE